MRTSAILLLALVTAAIGFFGGRASVPDPTLPIAGAAQATAPDRAAPEPALPRLPLPDVAAHANPRAELLRALELPAPGRNRAIRLAINAWLAADGAAAITAARDDPALGELAGRMMQLALHAYPEIFLEDPSLLEGIPNADQLIAAAARTIAVFDPDAARALIEAHLSGSPYGEAMLSAVDQIERLHDEPQSIEDAYAELESILAERNQQKRMSRLSGLVLRVAANDPVAAAELIDNMPTSAMMPAIGSLVTVWSETDPEAAARWLANKGAAVSELALRQVASRWGNRDFIAASAFADTLTGAQRRGFLSGLAEATRRMPKDEALAWLTPYEDDPTYPMLVMITAQGLASEDFDAAMGLIESLPGEAQLAAYATVLPKVAMEDPEAAIAVIDGLESESARDQLAPMLASFWAYQDARAAFDWARDLDPGRTRDQAMAAIASSVRDFDTDRAIDAINEIDDPKLRNSPIRGLLITARSDNEAIRLGRRFDYDRDAVLELRESPPYALSPFILHEGSSSAYFDQGFVVNSGDRE